MVEKTPPTHPTRSLADMSGTLETPPMIPLPTVDDIAAAFPNTQVWDQRILRAGFQERRTLFIVPLNRDPNQAVATIFNYPDEGSGVYAKVWPESLKEALPIVDALRAIGISVEA
jgi:hypothetical protein